jgi:signal transduction histidine kinase
MFRSLKKEMLAFTLGLAAAIIVIMTAIGVLSTGIAGDHAASATSDSLRDQAANYLLQIALSAAQQQDATFERMKNDTNVVASYVSHLYEHPALFPTETYWRFDERVWREDGRYLNRESDVSSIEIPASVLLDNAEKKHIELTANLDFIVPGILRSYPDTVAIYSIDTAGVTRYFPNIVLGKLAPPEYDPRSDIYYDPATPDKNPEKKIVWSPVYDDVVGRGLMISVTAPVYTTHGFAGIVASDILLKNIIDAIMAYSPVEGSYAFLIDKNGYAVALPDAAYRDVLGRSRATDEVRTDLASSTAGFQPIIARMKNAEQGFASVRTSRGDLFVAYAPLQQTGFGIAIVAEQSVMLKAVAALRTEITDSIRDMITYRILPASLLIVLVALIASVALVERIVKPIQELTRGAEEIGKGNFDYKIRAQSKNEIGTLAISFNQMSQALNTSRKALQEYSQGLEKKVAERTQELQKLSDEKSEFLTFASHEIRNPITAIRGYASLIYDGTTGQMSPETREAAQKILVRGNDVLQLIGEYLNKSKMEIGKVSFTVDTFDVTRTIAALVEDFLPNAKLRGLSLTFAAASESITIRADEPKLREVVGNLLDNSLKYTKEGGVTVFVERHGVSARIIIADTGVGIAPETLPQLFKKFSRADAQKVNLLGTGVGLYLGKQFIEGMGGRIWAESDGSDKGSRFIIEFPIDSPAA